MRLHHTFIALSLIAALSACTAAQDKGEMTKLLHAAVDRGVTFPHAL